MSSGCCKSFLGRFEDIQRTAISPLFVQGLCLKFRKFLLPLSGVFSLIRTFQFLAFLISPFLFNMTAPSVLFTSKPKNFGQQMLPNHWTKQLFLVFKSSQSLRLKCSNYAAKK